jgi:hypothetical protein
MKTQQRSEQGRVETARRPVGSRRGDRRWLESRSLLPGRTPPSTARPSKWLREELT